VDSTVVCVYKTGGDFDARYVRKLMDSALEHGADDFICLTDDMTLNQFCEVIPLEYDLPGWWSKLELFKLAGDNYIYFDLDTVIHGDIKPFLEYPHTFTMLRDFNKKANRPASGIMAWSGDYSHLLYDFDKREIDRYTPLKGGKLGDQAYIADRLGFQPDYVQDLFPELTCSHKWDTLETRQNRPVVCYHGKPRPHETEWEI